MTAEAVALTESVLAVINEIITAMIILAAMHWQSTRLLLDVYFTTRHFSFIYHPISLPFYLFLLQLSLAFVIAF